MTEPGSSSRPVTEPGTGPGTGDRAWYRFRYRRQSLVPVPVPDFTGRDHKILALKTNDSFCVGTIISVGLRQDTLNMA